MIADLNTELNAVCRVAKERKQKLLAEVQRMLALWQDVHTAITRDDYGTYTAAVDAMLPKRVTIAAMHANLQVTLRHEMRLREKAIDWALKAMGEGEPQTVEGTHDD
jgi:hypothetical protein